MLFLKMVLIKAIIRNDVINTRQQGTANPPRPSDTPANPPPSFGHPRQRGTATSVAMFFVAIWLRSFIIHNS
jgi:hypothetical protein